MKEKEFQSKPLLTKREREVFELLVQDKTTKEIASELFISEKTVRNHISNAKHIFYKQKQHLTKLHQKSYVNLHHKWIIIQLLLCRFLLKIHIYSTICDSFFDFSVLN